MDEASDRKDERTKPESKAPSEGFPQHPLVERVVHDPNTSPKLVVLVGDHGLSNREGFRRIYLDPSFRNLLRA